MRYKEKREKHTSKSRYVLLMLGLVIAILVCIYLVKCYYQTDASTTDDSEEITYFSTIQQQEDMKEPVISAYGPSESYYYIVTDDEAKALEKLVYAEAQGEPFEGKVAVAATILNRYTSKWSCFDTTSILSVITQEYQFADISSVTQAQLDEVPSCRDAVEAALKGWDPTRVEFEDGAKYFYAPDLVEGHQKEIREGIRVLTIGAHNFHEDFEKVE